MALCEDARVLTIGEVERATGLQKDTLRVWERRYGFPQPSRDAAARRRYTQEQVQTLCDIQILLRIGHRPRDIVPQSSAHISALIQQLPPIIDDGSIPESSLNSALSAIASHDYATFDELLLKELTQTGLRCFVIGFVGPLLDLIGRNWRSGLTPIFAEHVSSERVARALGAAIQAATSGMDSDGDRQRPVVLLTTLTGERHTLGLLMAEAMLVLAGCRCIHLGAETPLPELVTAVEAFDADIVALSFALSIKRKALAGKLDALRSALATGVDIWVGGSALPTPFPCVAGVSIFDELDQVFSRVEIWKRQSALALVTG